MQWAVHGRHERQPSVGNHLSRHYIRKVGDLRGVELNTHRRAFKAKRPQRFKRFAVCHVQGSVGNFVFGVCFGKRSKQFAVKEGSVKTCLFAFM